jgi:hypothetical protein
MLKMAVSFKGPQAPERIPESMGADLVTVYRTGGARLRRAAPEIEVFSFKFEAGLNLQTWNAAAAREDTRPTRQGSLARSRWIPRPVD